MFVNAFLFLFPKCSLSVHEHGKERRTLSKIWFVFVFFLRVRLVWLFRGDIGMAKAWTVPTCLWCAVLVVGMTSAQVRASSRRSENNERSVSVCDFANPEQPVSRKDGLSSRMRSIHLPRPSSQKWSEQRQQAVLEASHVKRKIEAEARLAVSGTHKRP